MAAGWEFMIRSWHMDYNQLALEKHAELKGKIGLEVKSSLATREDLSWAYTPGVAEPCRRIAENKEDVWKYTARGNWVAVVSDGSAVLGLGDIGPEAALPVMEGKAALFKEFGGVDAFPLVLDTQDVDEIVAIVKAMAPSFGGINLEDISAPRCFEIEKRLTEELDIPVFHDDQHGTAVVTLAAVLNALKVVGKKIEDVTVAMSGAGAAGIACAKILIDQGVGNVIMADSRGILSSDRDNLNDAKKAMLAVTNRNDLSGSLTDAMRGVDVFIGVSAPGVVNTEMVQSMNEGAVVIAMANPVPEIMPDEAKAGGAVVVATGRSDFANQVNNVLAFPGIFRGALDVRAKAITSEMKLAAAKALADSVEVPTAENIMPDVLDKRVSERVAEAVREVA